MAYATAFWPTDYGSQDHVKFILADAAADLPAGTEGDFAYQKDTNQYAGYDGAAWFYLVSGAATLGTAGQVAFFTATNVLGGDAGMTYVAATDTLTVGTLVLASTPLALAYGGTAAALTASNGGVFYSTAAAGAILAGTATARQMLQSGASTTPAWSTTTWPATTTINRILFSSAASVISEIATVASGVLVTGAGAGVPSIATDIPTAVTIGTAYVYRIGGTDVSLADGGTAASLTADLGAIVYSTASALALLASTATARQMLQSGASAAPAWSTTTWPATTTINRILFSSAASVIGEIATVASGVLVTGAGAGVPSIATDIPTAVTIGAAYIYRVGGTDVSLADGGTNASLTADLGAIAYSSASAIAFLASTATAKQILMSGASAAPIWSTATYPATVTASRLLYASGTNAISDLATANSGVLVTSGAGVPSIATDIPTAVTIGTAYIYRVGGTDVAIADGGTGQSTATLGFNALSPITTRGDLITRDATNNIRLGIGLSAKILQSNGTDPSWVALSVDATIAAGGALTIANDAVTYAKMQNVTDARLLGRSAGSAGDPQEITVGSGLSLAAGALTGTISAESPANTVLRYERF